MFFVRIEHAAVIVLVLLQNLGSTSVGRSNNETETPFKTIANYIRFPWFEGIDWLANSTESPERKEVRAFVRGVESREPWALQILETLWKDELEIRERRIGSLDSSRQCTKRADDIDSPDGTVSKYTTPDCRNFCVSGSDASLPHADCNGQIVNHVTHKTPEKSEDFTMAEITVIILFLVLTVFLLGCTVCDFVKKKKLEKWSATVHTLAKFSLYTNALSLLDMKPTSEMMPAINGIKCLSSFMVMYGHRHFALAVMLNRKIYLLDILKEKHGWFYIFLIMSPFAVDTFCVIGGFLGAYMFFKFKRSGTKFTVLTMYFYRYLRLTPSIIVMLLFVTTLFHRCGSGPIWEFIVTYVIGPCRGYWWANLLYIQNMMGTEKICLGFSWYLAADMQLFLLFPLILYPLHWSPKFGLRLLGFSLIMAVATSVIMLVVNDYSTVWLRLDQDFPKLMKTFEFYMSTYNRAFPYLIGILLGYDVATKRRRLTQANVTINWTVAASIILFCTWLHNGAYNTAFTDDWNVRIASILLLSPLWSIATAWLIYACTQGYGGLITRFLSLPIFLPLSRISYSFYLVHMAIQAITINASESSDSILGSDMFNGVLGNLVLTIPVAFVFTLFIESPTITLTKILMTSWVRQPVPGSLAKECVKDKSIAAQKDQRITSDFQSPTKVRT